MSLSCAAFATPLAPCGPCLRPGAALARAPLARGAARAAPLRRARLVMAADGGEEESVSLTDGSTDAASILKEMRSTAAEDAGPRTLNTGVTRDADGKSNVWAVEPTLEVDEKPQLSKGAILGAVFAAVGVALLVLPQLPFVNADQF